MSASQIIAGANLLSRPAEEFENDFAVEAMWAEKAFEYAQVHFNILCSVDPKYLKLTKHDDEIYRQFRMDFPDMRVDVLNEDIMKSSLGKQKWRAFSEKLRNQVEDANFGTLLRIDVSGEYSEENTFLSPRIQFYAVEVARNKEGYNDDLKERYRPILP